MSLRDMVTHKGLVEIDTYITDQDRGAFYITVDRENVDDPVTFLDGVFEMLQIILYRIWEDIRRAEEDLVQPREV